MNRRITGVFPSWLSLIVAAHDTVVAALSIVVALYLRLGDAVFVKYSALVPTMLLFTALATIVFVSMGLYRGMWRYASMEDLAQIIKASSLAILLFLPALFLLNRLEAFPRSVFVIHWLVLVVALGASRYMYRFVKDKTRLLRFFHSLEHSTAIPVLLVGISETAIHFLRECKDAQRSKYQVVGIIDGSRKHVGHQIQGVSVYGQIEDIKSVIRYLSKKRLRPQRLILGLERAEGGLIQELLKTAESLGLTLAKLPKITDFKEHSEKLDIRPIAIEDLLGRAPTPPKPKKRRDLIEGKRILVTGAGGTIGSELVRQMMRHEPERVVVLDHCEYNLYKIDSELKERFPGTTVRCVLLDVRDEDALERLFALERPELVFHAAALKHVPLVEENLVEACKTNILAVKYIADLCVKYHVHKMIFISTDKAVNPSSFMGVTKRMAERYIAALNNTKKRVNETQFTTVRFGNVLGSSGSVIPLFQEQLAKGGPLTITHPEMVRFFMTVPEAVELVLTAATIDTRNATGDSSLFVLDMGNPVRIQHLAEQMIGLSGLKLHEDIEIVYTGIRPGEKLYEELFYEHEKAFKTGLDGIMKASFPQEDLVLVEKELYDIAALCTKRDDLALHKLLIHLVPQYISERQATFLKVV